jgi:hypothetical protein
MHALPLLCAACSAFFPSYRVYFRAKLVFFHAVSNMKAFWVLSRTRPLHDVECKDRVQLGALRIGKPKIYVAGLGEMQLLLAGSLLVLSGTDPGTRACRVFGLVKVQ